VNCCEVCNVNDDDNHNHYYCCYYTAVTKIMTSIITREKNDDDDDTCTGCPEDPNKKCDAMVKKISHLDQQQLILATIQLLLHY
jgi:hypothetical protein